MRINTVNTLANVKLSLAHRVAYHNVDIRNPLFLDGICTEASDLRGSVDDGFADQVVKAIASFGINGVTVDSIECGPVVTRVNLVLPRGVRIKSVSDLANDLAMQLRVSSVAFVQNPQKGFLCLDVPAANRKTVLPGNIKNVDVKGMALPIALGVNVTGEARAIDLAKTPHLLIAGQTGSGKSVCINSIVMSLISHVSMDDFDMMLIDPKGVELAMYATLPNVINKSVLVKPAESMNGLRWLCEEMERRYEVLARYGKRNISSYNEWVKTQPVGVDCVEKMRYVVCVVDEFADLMMASGAELTQLVQVLAQKSRAVGIHIILATQRPSVKVVTDDLKANLPCRIAFKVSTATDSATILGHGGAEQLLGMGDMILHTDTSEERLHGVYFSDKNIEKNFYAAKFSLTDLVGKSVDFLTGKVFYDDGVPSWVMETISGCDHRPLSVNAPEWLRILVNHHKLVWTEGNGPKVLGNIIARMMQSIPALETVRQSIEYNLTGLRNDRVVRDLTASVREGFETLIRLPSRALNSIAVYNADLKAARSGSAAVNDKFYFDKMAV